MMRKKAGFAIALIGLIFVFAFKLNDHNLEGQSNKIVVSDKHDAADIETIINKNNTALLPVSESITYKNDKFQEYSYQEKIQREAELNRLAVEHHKLTPISGAKLFFS